MEVGLFGITQRIFHWHSLRELLLTTYISKRKSEHAHIFWVISFPRINIVLTGFFWSLSMLYWTNNKGVPKAENLRPKIAWGVCVYKWYERSKSLVDTCSGSLAYHVMSRQQRCCEPSVQSTKSANKQKPQIHKQTRQASAILPVQNSDVIRAVLRNLESWTPTTKRKNSAFSDSVPSGPSN